MSEGSLITQCVVWLKSEPGRLRRALGHAVDGLRAAFSQAAFRLEVLLAVPLTWWVLHLKMGMPKKLLLIGALLLVLVVELLNSAIETALDRYSTELHPLTRKAKDMAAAAVLLAVGNAVIVWWCLL